jgi:hypothetical protein
VLAKLGRRLEPSALRLRNKRGCAAAGVRPVRLHGLRHAVGSLTARTSDPVFVRDFLGHAKLGPPIAISAPSCGLRNSSVSFAHFRVEAVATEDEASREIGK